MKIVFLDSTAIPAHLPIPRPRFEHQWIEYETTTPEQVIERMQGAQVAVTSKVIFNREVMQQLPDLKLIAITATGTNNVDLDAARELGIEVKNVSGYSSLSVPEHVLGLIFALRHSLIGWTKDHQQDKWANSPQFCYFDHPLKDVKGSVLGIVGKGSLGSETGRLASLLGMKVIYAERPNATTCREGYLPFDEVLAQADILSLHCPLTPETHNLMNQETFAKMKKGALFINTGRGGLVDELALLQALESGHLSGAGIDVMQKEPPEKDNPLLQAAKYLPNLIITPHIAWASDSAVQILVEKVRGNIEQFFQDQAKADKA